MRRTTIINPKEIKQTTFREAEENFFKHCKLKNLRPRSIEYYREDLHFFHAQVPVRYVDEISQEVFENFIVNELEQGKKVSSLNTRIRGLRVFFKFCAEREYMPPLTLKLMKEDEAIKEPYTDTELRRLLKKPAAVISKYSQMAKNSVIEGRTLPEEILLIYPLLCPRS